MQTCKLAEVLLIAERLTMADTYVALSYAVSLESGGVIAGDGSQCNMIYIKVYTLRL